ncbi:MAG: hypothetical protein F6J98_41375 [Moorea sp. SIO4G2]|nr:hypothetical protein [Moorena sp. SIO4G2]
MPVPSNANQCALTAYFIKSSKPFLVISLNKACDALPHLAVGHATRTSRWGLVHGNNNS